MAKQHQMIHRACMIVWCALAAGVTSVRCVDNTEVAGRRHSEPPRAAQARNPFSSEDGPIVPALTDCVRIVLEFERAGAALRRSVAIVRNECVVPVAILTTPSELRVRKTEDDRFAEQTVSTAAHSTFYVAPASVGLSHDMFFGDGGNLLYGEPRYSVVPARSQRSIPIKGSDRLLASLPGGGDISVALVAMVVAVSPQHHGAEPFDLRVGVDALNRESSRDGRGVDSQPFRLSRLVQQVGASATF
ncbi:MAG TPA: hypothetical protein VGF28_15165 [Thermoanaerobaculia bacterium]|jgi:hypothetical protein